MQGVKITLKDIHCEHMPSIRLINNLALKKMLNSLAVDVNNETLLGWGGGSNTVETI